MGDGQRKGMRITIVAVGKLREPYLQQGVEEYRKRLGRYATVSLVEVAEEQAPETLSAAEQAQVRARESERLLRALREGQYVVALALEGRQFTSPDFAAHLEALGTTGRSDLAFLIGGSLGLAPPVLARADLLLSFGHFTYPHQLMRLLLVEQVYRAYRIMRGEPYHK